MPTTKKPKHIILLNMGRKSKYTFSQRRHGWPTSTWKKMVNITNHQRNVNQNHEVSPYTYQNGYDLEDKK